MKVKILMTRCLKDKVSSGHYIMICSVLDRIGGTKITYDSGKSEQAIKEVS